MAAIDIVTPVSGAPRVTFNYGAASDALDALSRMAGKLGEQIGGRAEVRDEVSVNWQGRFRDEFDRAWSLLDGRFANATEGAGWAQLPIYTAIADANDTQREFNRAAELAASQPPPTSRPTSGPI
ncbi:MAG: hypothetical protein ACRD0U_13920 [Acidimicrobiales bacterium]